MEIKKTWWKESVVYQIYPRSFRDSNGDGIGDLGGIISKLDYIKDLGVDVIWLCPIYESPNDDNGYDISDYRNILGEYGTMQEFDILLDKVHENGMKLIMDLVVNHTSDEHEWFVESRTSRDSNKRDYYIWKDGSGNNPPNNWKSFFSGDAWELDEQTGQYYLHLFTRKQPDLNWENPKVRKEVHNIVRFWLDKGVDGFRMDVISLISKRGYEDSKYPTLNETIDHIYANGPRVHEFLNELNHEVLRGHDVFTVGEGPGINLSEGLNYVDQRRKELDMIFHFGHMFMDHGPGGRFDPVPYDFISFKKVFRDWDALMHPNGWTSVFLGNHDFPRLVSRFGNDQAYWEKSSKLFALLLMTLRGTPYVFQGDEIGMTNVGEWREEDFRDVEILNYLNEVKNESGDYKKALKMAGIVGRDNSRTPMQWDDSTNAGFTGGNAWLKVNPNFRKINVKQQIESDDSILQFYREVIRIRKSNKTLVYGDFHIIDLPHEKVFAYWRSDKEHTFLVVLNFSDENQRFPIDSQSELHLLKSNYEDTLELSSSQNIELRPWEANLYKM